MHIAGDDWLEENPNAAVRFLRATIKSRRLHRPPRAWVRCPENKDKVLDIYEANDFDVADLRAQDSPWVLDGHLRCENLYYDKAAWDTTIETQQLDPLDFDNVDLSYLEKAQELRPGQPASTDEISYP